MFLLIHIFYVLHIFPFRWRDELTIITMNVNSLCKLFFLVDEKEAKIMKLPVDFFFICVLISKYHIWRQIILNPHEIKSSFHNYYACGKEFWKICSLVWGMGETVWGFSKNDISVYQLFNFINIYEQFWSLKIRARCRDPRSSKCGKYKEITWHICKVEI